MNKKGFTLVEILAVIVILSLVVVIVSTKGFGAFDNTKKKITEENLKTIKESANILATQIESCDDDVDSELWEGDDSLANLNGISNDKKDCSGLKEKMSSNECISVTVGYLIENNYLSDNDDFTDIKNNKIKICKNSNKIVINTDEIDKKDSDDNTKDNEDMTLAKVIIKNAKEAQEKNDAVRTIYQEVPSTKPAEEISSKTEKTLSIAPDDYGTSYYFRGNVIDNYVDFAGMCWRVVRIEGDGSVKLILEDQDSTCANSDGNWNIPTETGGTTKTGNFGYTHYAAKTLTASDGTTNSKRLYLMNYLNGETLNNKSMATAFNNFQTGPLASYLSYLKVGDWCLNDKAYATSNDNTTALTSQEILDKQIKGATFYYDSYIRLDRKKIPTLKCNGTNMNKFADNTCMYVGTLTADEIVYCGGKLYVSNPDYYLINNYQSSTRLYFWSLSPNYFRGSAYAADSFGARSFGLDYDGQVDHSYVDLNSTLSFRPAVSLKSGISITGGDGTKDNSYKLKLE